MQGALPAYCCLYVLALAIAAFELIVAPSMWRKISRGIARRNDNCISDNYGRNMDLKKYTIAELLETHTAVLNELRDREILRSANNPTGDYAEWLFCQAFGWDQAANSVKGFDATDAEGIRYQIKGRRLHQLNTSRQLSAIRDMDGFDVLSGVLFDAAFVVSRAALIPSAIVSDRSKFTKHTNSHRFMLRDDIWNADGVVDVTANLQRVATNCET